MCTRVWTSHAAYIIVFRPSSRIFCTPTTTRPRSCPRTHTRKTSARVFMRVHDKTRVKLGSDRARSYRVLTDLRTNRIFIRLHVSVTRCVVKARPFSVFRRAPTSGGRETRLGRHCPSVGLVDKPRSRENTRTPPALHSSVLVLIRP